MLTYNANMLSVEQAVYTSSERGLTKGYQLVSKSAGIDGTMSQELCRWAPTRLPNESAEDWTLSCFRVSNECVAIARTTHGGPEYSGRGGTQVVTLILVLRDVQLEGYDFNVVSVARNSLAMGCLRLPLNLEFDQLPQASLPKRSIVDNVDRASDASTSDEYEEALDKIVSMVEAGRRVAVIGCVKAIVTADRLIGRMSSTARHRFSFTTGLEPSTRRPFQAHFFREVDLRTRHLLQSQDIFCVNMPL